MLADETKCLDGEESKDTFELKWPNELAVISQPSSYIGKAGDTATLTAEAKGEQVRYQWQYLKNGEWIDLTFDGLDSSELTIVITEELNGLQYRCIVTDFVWEYNNNRCCRNYGNCLVDKTL